MPKPIPSLLFVVALVAGGLAAAEPAKITFAMIGSALAEVQSRPGGTIIGTYVVALADSEFDSLRADADLGPFIAAIRDGEDAFVAIIPAHGSHVRRVVFFRDGVPTAFSFYAASSEDRAQAVQDNRMLPRSSPKEGEPYQLEPGELTADDGTPVKGFRVLAAAKP